MDTKIILCHKEDFPYIEEYINSVFSGITLFQYENSTTEIPVSDYYMCIRRVPFNILPKDCKIGFVNTEQLCVPDKYEEYKTFLRDDMDVFDYSAENIKISKRGEHLPYKKSEEENEILKSYLNVKKEFDVGIIGTDSEYRTKYVKLIRNAGFRVKYITKTFGKERDQLIGRCSALVLIHYNEKFNMYESLRWDRWKYAGIPILSEECRENPDGIKIMTEETVVKKLTKLIGSSKVPEYKIGLSMIVKNESHIIHEVMESTLLLIDTYVIVDTGSTDNTIQIIKDFYAKHKVEGIVYERPWKGFGESRSEALKLCNGQMDYILMIDADDLMCFPDANAKKVMLRILNETSPNSCNVHIKRGTLEYERTQIFKANDDWRYVGVLHEYPTNDKKNNIIVRLPNEIYMIGRTMGARSLEEGDKYAKDAAVIEEALKTEPDNERYMFYLAQSYRDCGNHPKAIEWYTKRYEIGRWAEERFISALNLTRLLNSKEWAWKAHELSPIRIESLVAYVTYCRMSRTINHETLSIILYASTISRPTGTVLFLEKDTYEWRVWDELAMTSLILGKFDLTKMACTKLLKEGFLPPEHTDRVKQIFKHAITLQQQQIKG